MNLTRNKSEDSSKQAKTKKTKPKGLEVGKFESSDNKVTFFTAKGMGKKKWVAVREIPVLEIEHIENVGNELTVTWKGVTEWFFTKEKTGSFSPLVEQVNAILEEQKVRQQQTVEANEKAALRRSELLAVINSSIGIVDLSFDLLIVLQDKRINWQQIEAFCNGLTEKLNFTGQTLPPLKLDYSKIGVAVKTQRANEASKEAFDVLKAAYGYFDSLNPDDDLKENPPNFQTVKTLIHAYYLLNDLLLGEFVGDKENARENTELEAALQSLAKVNFKVDVEELRSSINVEGDKQTVVDNSRAIFKEQLKQLTAKPEITAEPAPELKGAQEASKPQEASIVTPSKVTPDAQPVEAPRTTEQPTVPTTAQPSEPSTEPATEPLTATAAELTLSEEASVTEQASVVQDEPKERKRSWFRRNRKTSDTSKDN